MSTEVTGHLLNLPRPQPRTRTDPPSTPPRRRALALAALSGLLLVGAFPHLDWGGLAWVALVPFLSTFPHRRMRDALWGGAVLGLVFFGGLWYWMAVFAGHVIGRLLGLVVWVGASLAQTVTVGVFALGAEALSRRPGVWAWRLGVPALWTVGEWARQFGPLGTGWGDLAYTQHAALLPLQMTKLSGVFGLSFVILLVNVALTPPPPPILGEAPSERLRPDKARRGPGDYLGVRFPLGVAGLVLAVLLYGAVTLRTERLRPTFAAAALQIGIDENVPWKGTRPADPVYTRRVMDAYAAQAQAAAARGARLVVWPETAFPGYLRADAELRAEAAAMATRNNQATLIGGVDYDFASRKAANTLFLLDAGGNLRGEYQKQRLVPFGEYVPYRRWLPFLDALHLSIYDMEPGGARQPVLDAGPPVGKIGAAICYDSTDGEIVRRQVARGAGLLVVTTDDAWFGRTAAARQHTACAAVRAAEDDRYLVRCAATGISQVIAPTGRVIAEGGLFTQKLVLAPVQPRRNLTLYARWGDWFVALCALALVFFLLPRPQCRGGRFSKYARLAGSARSWGR
ncbi:MAG: apolipoprotein N-acyltransferase [Armatimonadetes bacterium]|nr:apolipoprotein N-acyltransferase [Armatimonadota bacterium]